MTVIIGVPNYQISHTEIHSHESSIVACDVEDTTASGCATLIINTIKDDIDYECQALEYEPEEWFVKNVNPVSAVKRERPTQPNSSYG